MYVLMWPFLPLLLNKIRLQRQNIGCSVSYCILYNFSFMSRTSIKVKVSNLTWFAKLAYLKKNSKVTVLYGFKGQQRISLKKKKNDDMPLHSPIHELDLKDGAYIALHTSVKNDPEFQIFVTVIRNSQKGLTRFQGFHSKDTRRHKCPTSLTMIIDCLAWFRAFSGINIIISYPSFKNITLSYAISNLTISPGSSASLKRHCPRGGVHLEIL